MPSCLSGKLIKMYKELKKITELFNETEEINHIGAWEMDLLTRRTIWTDEIYKIHEIPKDIRHKEIEKLYSIEDKSAILSAINQTFTTEEPFVITFCFVVCYELFTVLYKINRSELGSHYLLS